MTVDEVKRLTLWQVMNLFIRPAIKRAKELKRESNPEGPMELAEVELTPREQWIDQESEANPGNSRDYWERLYDLIEANQGQE